MVCVAGFSAKEAGFEDNLFLGFTASTPHRYPPQSPLSVRLQQIPFLLSPLQLTLQEKLMKSSHMYSNKINNEAQRFDIEAPQPRELTREQQETVQGVLQVRGRRQSQRKK